MTIWKKEKIKRQRNNSRSTKTYLLSYPNKRKIGSNIHNGSRRNTNRISLYGTFTSKRTINSRNRKKDAIGMLINSINLINNAKNKIGKVNYIVIGVEMKKNDMWYFIASIGDIAAFVKGSIEMEELLKRITVKKGMKNIFN
jgi:transcription antitermination factor NusG